MTPIMWDQQVIPQHTTRHALSVKLGCKVFYRDDVTPHQKWNGLCWSDLGLNGDCHPYTSLLSDEPYMHVSKSYNQASQDQSPIYTDARYKGD